MTRKARNRTSELALSRSNRTDSSKENSTSRRRCVCIGYEQSLVQELPNELVQVAAELRFVDVVFVQESGDDRLRVALFGEEVPDPGADGVEAEINTGAEMQQDSLAGQVTEDDLVGNPEFHRFRAYWRLR